MEDGAVKVVSPFRGSPAEKAGIKAGDFITHLNGKLIYGGDLDEAVEQMRGPAGTSINLTIFRPGSEEPIETSVTRGVIELEPVTHTLADGNIGIITVNEFSRDVGADVFAAWGEIQTEASGRVNGLVLDLRSNPGGSLDEAVALSDLFLDDGRIVSQRGRARGESITYNAETMYRGQIAADVPLIVLIDAGSASASEIVAGALQDHRRALVMGERSFGKGSVQSLVQLGSNAALKLTTARYYTPDGHSVQEGGIKPDIRVPQISDPDLERRMKYQLRESDLRGHLINEAQLKDDDLERDLKADPRFSQTAAELKEQGIEDFQLDYAIKTLRRTTASSVALRK
jgi:carboxyl-terminal processing protease